MRGRAIVVAVAVLGAGCASFPFCAVDQGGRQVEQTDALARGGQADAARGGYEPGVDEPSHDAARARTQYRLALLYVDPSSGLPDYRAAQVAFERLLADYPNSEWEVDARAWRALLIEISARQADALRLRGETRRLKTDLRGREAETARLREESAKLKADLQRLKQIDLEAERRR